MKFSELSVYLKKLDETSSRNEITVILSELFKNSDKVEIDKICYMMLGSLAPTYRSIVFNIAEKMMVRAVAKAFGVSDNLALKQYKKAGDLGKVVYSLSLNLRERETEKLKNEKTERPSVLEVYERLYGIAIDEGEGSVERKIENIAKLLSELDPLSAKYVARIPVGKLRLGFSDKTIIDALSWMEAGTKSKSKKIEEAYNVLPDVGLLAKKIKEFGIEKAAKLVSPVIGVPVLPTLAQRLKSPSEMINKMGKVAIESKFDGLRIQIHYKKLKTQSSKVKTEGQKSETRDQEYLKTEKQNTKYDELTNQQTYPDLIRENESTIEVKAFTRNLNECSWMFPELNDIGEYIKADEIILDTEAVGVDEDRLTMANFQATMTRRRKYNIEETSKKVSIKFHVFDCLYVNGASLMSKSYLERRECLSRYVKSGKLVDVVDYVVTQNSKVIEMEMKKKLSEGLEGIIVKRTSSYYSAGRTGWRWVKMKEEEGSYAKLADTVDCVVMGYFAGRGKRSGFGLGGFLVGVRDVETIVTISKIGTGLTDEQFRELKKRLKNLEVKEKPKEYGEVDKILVPDVWVNPSLVVEIAADDITKSPNQSSGYSLRFPRLVKFRDDKKWDQATTLGEIKKMFEMKKNS